MISVVGYMLQLELGLGVASRRFFADAYHNGGPEEANHVLGQLFRVYALLALLVMMLAVMAVRSPPAPAATP